MRPCERKPAERDKRNICRVLQTWKSQTVFKIITPIVFSANFCQEMETIKKENQTEILEL